MLFFLMIVPVFHQLIDCLIVRSFNSFLDRLIDQLGIWLINWLIDWILIKVTFLSSAFGGRRCFGQDPCNRLLPAPGSDIPPLAPVQCGLNNGPDTRLSAHGTFINEKWSTASIQTSASPRSHKARFSAVMELTEIGKIPLPPVADSSDVMTNQNSVSLFTMAPPRPKLKRLMDKPKPAPRVNPDGSLLSAGTNTFLRT